MGIVLIFTLAVTWHSLWQSGLTDILLMYYIVLLLNIFLSEQKFVILCVCLFFLVDLFSAATIFLKGKSFFKYIQILCSLGHVLIVKCPYKRQMLEI